MPLALDTSDTALRCFIVLRKARRTSLHLYLKVLQYVLDFEHSDVGNRHPSS